MRPSEVQVKVAVKRPNELQAGLKLASYKRVRRESRVIRSEMHRERPNALGLNYIYL